MAIESTRDLEQSRLRFIDWLAARMPDADDVSVDDLVRPESSGFSNDTMLCTASWRAGGEGRSRGLVVRVAPDPSVYRVFPFYDIPRQFDIMRALGSHTDIPVPPCLWKEYDPATFGQPFYVMERVSGEVPPDNPPYFGTGVMFDATPEQRREMWNDGLDVLARIHAVDWRRIGLDFLAWPDSGRSAIEQHLDFYEAYLSWAARGKPQPVMEAALRFLRERMPVDEPDVISWGDSRIGNQMYRDCRVVATLDWEMVAIGSPDVDLGWWLFAHQVLQRGGGPPGQPDWGPMPGLPDEAETVAHYERLSGHAVRHLHYYQVFAGLRFGCVMIRIMQSTSERMGLSEEDGLALERTHMVAALTAELLGMPAPT